MKSSVSVVMGVVLLVVSGFVLLRGGYVTTRREVVDVGGLQITADRRSPVAPWVAGIGIVIGAGLVLNGLVGGTRRA